MEKYILLSDLHLTGRSVETYSCNSDINYRKAVSHIAEHHTDAQAIFCMGDISNDGSEISYRYFSECNQELTIPYHTLLGNHDSFLQASNHIELDTYQGRYVQFSKAYGNKIFIFLDTTVPGRSSGSLCSSRMNWLKRVLEQSSKDKRDVYLFMHHNPFQINVKCYDDIGLENSDKFYKLLSCFSDIVKHVFFGHCHQNIHGEYQGVPYTTIKGTNHQLYPDLSGDKRFKICNFEPSYYVMLFGHGGLYFYNIEFNKTLSCVI
ncbi:MAG: metallophosphoesterase [Reinekea sp.]|jgi:3',5'-cyclic-AMP phosphodiesterase